MSDVFIVSPNSWLQEGVIHTLKNSNALHCYSSVAVLLKAEPVCTGWLLLHIPNTGGDQPDIVTLASLIALWAARGLQVALLVDHSHNNAMLKRWLNITHVFDLTRSQLDFIPWFTSWTQNYQTTSVNASPLSLLTGKDWALIQATSQGISLASLGDQLGENIKTLHSRRKGVIKKLGLQTTRELQLIMIRWGSISHLVPD